MDRRYDLAIALVVLAFGVFVFTVARTIPMGYTRDAVGPRAFFFGIGILFLAGGSFVAMRLLRSWKSQKNPMIPSDGKEDDDGYSASALRAALVMGTFIGYAAVLKPLGYLLATPVFIIGALVVLGERKWWQMIVIAVSFTVVFYVAFAQLLNVRIPVGPFAPLFLRLGWIYL